MSRQERRRWSRQAPPGPAGAPAVTPAAPTDELTGCGDLIAFRLRLQEEVAAARPGAPRAALLLIDLDGFHRFNDLHGRAVGDQLLAVTASRLRGFVADGALYRVGGDQFGIMVPGVDAVEAVAFASRVLQAVGAPLDADPGGTLLSASVAVVMLGHRDRADGVMRDADLTMFRAKAEGGGRVDVYNWELDDWAMTRKRDVERMTREMDDLRLENQVLAQAMTTDQRTGIPNALAFDADHVQVHARRSRSGEPYAVLMAGLDGFDASPHAFESPAGARAVRAVAHCIRDTVRLYDRAYRYDEGEFAVLLQLTDMRQAVAAAERVRVRVHKLGLESPASPTLPLTVSIAVVEAGFRHNSAKDVLTEVSELLHASLPGGANRIVWPH